MSFGQQIAWLASYDRKTGALSTHAAQGCGYGDILRAGYVIDRGPEGMPDLFITEVGKDVVAIYSQPVRREGVVQFTGS